MTNTPSTPESTEAVIERLSKKQKEVELSHQHGKHVQWRKQDRIDLADLLKAHNDLLAEYREAMEALKELIKLEWEHAEQTGHPPPASIAAGMAVARDILTAYSAKESRHG